MAFKYEEMVLRLLLTFSTLSLQSDFYISLAVLIPQEHVRKVVGGFGKKSCVSTGVRKPGNTYASPTAMI